MNFVCVGKNANFSHERLVHFLDNFVEPLASSKSICVNEKKCHYDPGGINSWTTVLTKILTFLSHATHPSLYDEDRIVVCLDNLMLLLLCDNCRVVPATRMVLSENCAVFFLWSSKSILFVRSKLVFFPEPNLFDILNSSLCFSLLLCM